MSNIPGYIVFDTYPSDAKVFVNQKPLGNSPIEVTDATEDRYYYVISKEGYKDYDNEVYVQSGKISHVYINLSERFKREEYVDVGKELTDFTKEKKDEENDKDEPPTSTPSFSTDNISSELLNRLIDTQSKTNQLLETQINLLNQISFSVYGRTSYDNFYNLSHTIVAGDGGGHSAVELDLDSLIYIRDRVHEILGRNAETINVHNQSKVSLYARVSHSGSGPTNFSIEEEIIQGETKKFYNIYEIRVRSSLLSATYEVTEYDVLEFSDPRLTPLEKATVESVDTTAFVDILADDLTPVNSPAMFIVYVVLGVPGIFYYRLTTSTLPTGTLIALNHNADLQELSLYRFQIPVHTGDSINFATSVTGTGGIVVMLRVQETNAAIF